MTRRRPDGTSSCLICGETYANNVHLARHIEARHSMFFRDYDWAYLQGNTQPPLCAANCGQSRSHHSGRYSKYCGPACAHAAHQVGGAGRARVTQAARLVGLANTMHGESRKGQVTPEYQAYHQMLIRCGNPNHRAFRHYGGRGIKVCERWLGGQGFAHFLQDMGRRPGIDFSLDRYPNNDGDYEPANCRWATRSQQQRNKRRPAEMIARFEGQPEMSGNA